MAGPTTPAPTASKTTASQIATFNEAVPHVDRGPISVFNRYRLPHIAPPNGCHR